MLRVEPLTVGNAGYALQPSKLKNLSLSRPNQLLVEVGC
jgi:hypothetical protein